MGDIVNLPVITRLNLDPDRTLENLKGSLSGFVICGYDKEGHEFFASTFADGGETLWIVERFKKALLEVVEDE